MTAPPHDSVVSQWPSSPNAILFRIRISTCEFGVGDTNIQSVTSLLQSTYQSNLLKTTLLPRCQVPGLKRRTDRQTSRSPSYPFPGSPFSKCRHNNPWCQQQSYLCFKIEEYGELPLLRNLRSKAWSLVLLRDWMCQMHVCWCLMRNLSNHHHILTQMRFLSFQWRGRKEGKKIDCTYSSSWNEIFDT